MGSKILWLILLTQIIEDQYCHGDEVDCAKEPKCAIYRAFGMKAADCYKKDFYNFPKCIPTDVEVIELTLNRIRKFTKSDLNRYSYLKFLYLKDNLISKLDDETFTDLTSLSSLDLSINALIGVPPTIFHLSSLKTLILGQNTNIDIADAVEQAKPITSPLTVLDISLTAVEDSPVVFPDFGILPFLSSLNITGNHYVTIAPKHFAGLCNLSRLINNGTTTDYEDNCDCWIINGWLHERNVQFVPFVCPTSENTCSDKSLREGDLKMYDQCQSMYSQIQRTHRLTKIATGVGISVLVLVLIAGICFFWIRKRRNAKRGKKGKENNDTQTDGLVPLNKPNNFTPNN